MMLKIASAATAAVLTAMVFVGNAVAGEKSSHEESAQDTTKGMGVSTETTRGTATEGFTTGDDAATNDDNASANEWSGERK